jgi:threonine synthase
MGLPIGRLVVATNENDVLDEFFRTGTYRVRGSADTYETSSPSMDISKASNFERFVFDLLGRDAARTKQLFGDELRLHGRFDLGADPLSARLPAATASSAARARTPTAWPPSGTPSSARRDDRHPHRRRREGGARTPAPGGECRWWCWRPRCPSSLPRPSVEALGREPERPAKFDGIEALPKRVQVMPADVVAVKRCVTDHCPV